MRKNLDIFMTWGHDFLHRSSHQRILKQDITNIKQKEKTDILPLFRGRNFSSLNGNFKTQRNKS